MVNEQNQQPVQFNLGDKVVARWHDNKRYPGQIDQVLSSGNYLVLFEDGYRKIVKPNHLELNLNPVPKTELPFDDPREEREVHESDIVEVVIHCICGSPEDKGRLVQCEYCLTWQHATCFAIKPTDHLVAKFHTCPECSYPDGVRENSRYRFDGSWLRRGFLPNLLIDQESTESKKVATVNYLLEAAMECVEIIHGLKAKILLLNGNKYSDNLDCYSESWLANNIGPCRSNSTSSSDKFPIAKEKLAKSGSTSPNESGGGISHNDLDLNSSGSTKIDSIDDHSHSEDVEVSSASPPSSTDRDEVEVDNFKKDLFQHIEDIRSRLEIRLDYIESRIGELEEEYGADFEPTDLAADESKFRSTLKHLYKDLEIFKMIHSQIRQRRFTSDIGASLTVKGYQQQQLKDAKEKQV